MTAALTIHSSAVQQKWQVDTYLNLIRE